MAYVLESDAGRTVVYSSDDPHAVLAFTTRDRALAMADDTPAEAMQVVELTPQTVNAWVSKLKGHGIAEIIWDAAELRGAERARRMKFAKLYKGVFAQAGSRPKPH